MLEKTEKRFRIKVKGKTVDVVREQYLRTDVSCQSALCDKCEDVGKFNQLSHSVTHYLIPFGDVLDNYLEILAFPEIRGIIVPQTVAYLIQQEGRRSYDRLCTMIRDPRKECVLFVNEFCQQTFQLRQEGESLSSWHCRNTYNVGVWYSQHLDQKMPIVMITENAEIISRFEGNTDGVLLTTLKNYLQDFWSNLPTAYDIYESLTALSALEPNGTDLSSDYEEYVPEKLLDAGLKTGIYFCGMIKVNKHHSQMEAFVSTDGDKSSVVDKGMSVRQDILISGMKYRNRAIHGDIVYVQLLPVSDWKIRIQALSSHENQENAVNQLENGSEVQRTGKIVGISLRRWRDYVATFYQDEKFKKLGVQDRLLVIPYDYRIPKIRILTRQAPSLENHRIVVRIDSWETNSQYPNGHFLRSLGKIGEIDSEISTILIENEIRVSQFSPAVFKELPEVSDLKPWNMTDDEINRRRDLRETHMICSIDPKDCEDVDDALSVRALPKGRIEIGVHIADVTYFVRPNSNTDLEAQLRSTTVYLADRRYDMIPNILSSNLCSLLGNVDRYAVSVLWTLNKKYEVVDVWYGRTIIRSSYKLFYEAAQRIIDGASIEDLKEEVPCLAEENVERFERLRDSLLILTAVAHDLKEKRLLAGALELESNEVQCEFSKKGDGKVENITPREALDVHETVAECMIFANHWVAKKIFQVFPSHALLRHHPPPRQDKFSNLLACAKTLGFQINTSSNQLLAKSLNECIDPNDPNVNKLMRNMAVQAMTNALYCSSGCVLSGDFFHYGLALDFYTHFTSPIRRYSDVLVHRLLLVAIGEESFELLNNTYLDETCQHINNMHRAAQNAQKASVDLFQSLFFGALSPNDNRRCADAIIFSTRANGVLVYVPKYGVKGPLYLCNKTQQVAYVIDNNVSWIEGTVILESSRVIVRTALGEQSYRLFDHITVFIDTDQSHTHAPALRMELMNNRPHPESNDGIQPERFSQKKLVRQVIDQNVSDVSELNRSKDSESKFEKIQTISSFYQLLESLKEMALKAPK